MSTPDNPQNDFAEITQLIAAAKQRAEQAVNTALIDLYWQVGQTISRMIELGRDFCFVGSEYPLQVGHG